MNEVHADALASVKLTSASTQTINSNTTYTTGNTILVPTGATLDIRQGNLLVGGGTGASLGFDTAFLNITSNTNQRGLSFERSNYSLGNDVEAMQKASIFSDTFNVSAFAPNSFDRTSGGSLNIRHSDAVFDSYVSGMTNMVHSLALLRNFKSVLSDKNIRLIKEQYGSRFADELQNSVNDVIYGKNNSTKSDEKNYKGASRWLNQANASIMFLNFTSALTQPISFVNYAFEDIDSKVYFKNFTDMLSGDKKMAEARKEFLLDSAFLRRLTKNLSSIELTELQNSEFGEFTKLERVSSKVDDLLSKGFIMTTKMDSAAIRFGGIPYYAAKRDELFSEYSKTYKKEEAYKMAKK